MKDFMVDTALDVHQFHIPVMGTGFTIDTPLHVARYGISSVVSLVDDILIEEIHAYYAKQYGVSFEAVPRDHVDARALRIRAYLDFMADMVDAQFRLLQQSPFEAGSEITRYFSLLPDGVLRSAYERMLACEDPSEKAAAASRLREMIKPGAIDVNIMTKLDRIPLDKDGQPLDAQHSDAISALRGFAESKVKGGVVFSAGLNAPLYTAVSQYADFLPTVDGASCKSVILKVSDYRSAAIQGRFFAKRGIWVSEFRIESGLHCGGHAFATQGYLLGPILAEFQEHRVALQQQLHRDYSKALVSRGLVVPAEPRRMAVTAQGGIATHAEHRALMLQYGMDRTGWGTPFLLVPEATSLDAHDLQLLIDSKDGDIALSDSSPLGVPFWTLKTSTSEVAKEKRIAEGHPGSACPKGFLAFVNDMTDVPLCRASRKYQILKLASLAADDSLDPAAKALLQSQLLAKACICHELGGGVLLKYGLRQAVHSAICPSLSILHFKAAHTLEEMVGHIYGRWSLLRDQLRPHMFIRELSIYIDYLMRELDCFSKIGGPRKLSYYAEFKQHLLDGIAYYQQTFHDYVGEQRERFSEELSHLRDKLENFAIEV
ncbi:MAG: hypothetical protein ACNA71_04095 [Kiritimatiellia bacterium]